MLLLIVCAQECIHTELCRSAQGSLRGTRRSTSAGMSYVALTAWVERESPVMKDRNERSSLAAELSTRR